MGRLHIFLLILCLFSGCPGEWFFEAVHEAGGDSHCTYNLLSVCIASKKQASGHPLKRHLIFCLTYYVYVIHLNMLY
jgi:hypothetical protein